jgi:hypothetical protein
MTQTADSVGALVHAQLDACPDPVVSASLRSFLVTPALHLRTWEYGTAGTAYPCWTVASSPAHGTEIVYSEFGHGPEHPWGLVSPSMLAFGMDSGWFLSLEAAFLDSFMGAELPIWSAWRQDDNGNRFELARHLTQNAAFALTADFEARGHKQTYWVLRTVPA